MALEQEVDGSGQAKSGKNDKQDQVHRSIACGKCRLEKTGGLRGWVVEQAALGNPSRL
jgi:hypothetical protein